MPDLVAWRADPAPARVHAGTIRADRIRVRADYPITGGAIVLLVLQAVFLVPLFWELDVATIAVPVLLAVDALGFAGLWVLRERARRDVGAAHPDGLPPELVAVYGQDVRECRRLWDAARAR